MIGLRGEKLVELLILENLIEDPHLIDGRLSSLISDSSQSGKSEETEVNFPDECLVEHHEGETSIGN